MTRLVILVEIFFFQMAAFSHPQCEPIPELNLRIKTSSVGAQLPNGQIRSGGRIAARCSMSPRRVMTISPCTHQATRNAKMVFDLKTDGSLALTRFSPTHPDWAGSALPAA